MGFIIHLILKIGTLEIVKNRFRQKKKMKFNFFKENGIFDQKLQFLRFFRKFLVKVWKLIFLITITSTWVVLAPKTSAKCLTV